MKHFRRILFAALLILGGLFSFLSAAYAQYPSQEAITEYNANITVNKDNSVDVTETLSYTTGSIYRHGIYRDIYPYSSTKKKMAIENISVVDQQGNPYQYQSSTVNGNFRIKIGDPNQTFTGEKTYIIKYHATNAVAQFQNFDEIYWNVTGNEWQMPIYNAEATVILPSGATVTQSACYVGPKGSTSPCTIAHTSHDDVFISPSILNQGEGLTVAVGFPKGIVTPYTWKDSLMSFLGSSGIFPVVLPLLVLVGMFLFWYKKGRDPKDSGVIVPQYDAPDNLTPLELDGILHTRITSDKISAEIIYLATKGYLKITRLETHNKYVSFIKTVDYQIDLVRDYTDINNEFDRKILDTLFSFAFLMKTYGTALANLLPENRRSEKTILVSSLKNSFFSSIPLVTKSVFESLTTKGYYDRNPQKVIQPYMYIPTLLFIIAYIILRSRIFLFFQTSTIEWIISALACILIVYFFGKLMPKKTAQGAETVDYILGLKQYLEIAEKDRIEFHNAPEKNPALFEKLLPYAMVLGVEKKWAQEFENIYLAPPTWYHDSAGAGMFNAVIFANTMGNFTMVATENLSSSPRGSGSGGGGSSGGGGGGGGGGGW